ncbi:MAG: TIGR03663 family protein [Anaerolineae bacterium]|nr:TIGR03663 family protein [Anaerolineae bacterium]
MIATSKKSQETKAQDFWKIVAIVILILAVISRFYALGDRAVSHDEMTHAKFSWNLYTGMGFRHDPLMHGPLLFEVTSLIYALFGVSDFTARIWAALTGVALVMTPWLFQKWLGKRGALFASVMLLISPAITYYARYTRHDTPLMLMSILLLWTVLNYLDTGRTRWLYGMAAFFPLMYASKENAYIYTAIFLVLLILPFVWQVARARWARPRLFILLAVVVIVALLLGGVSVRALADAQVQEVEDVDNTSIANIDISWWGRLALGLTVIIILSAVPIIYYGVGEVTLRKQHLFDVLMTLGTLTLPLGSAFLMKFVAGVDMTAFYPALMEPTKFSELPLAMTLAALATFLVVMGLSIALGLWWDKKRWPIIALIHYGIFITLFSTFFTYGWGAMTGLIGGLTYWIAQQTVDRGSQPWYYYTIVGPLYEYMPLLLSIGTGAWGIIRPILKRAFPDPVSQTLEGDHEIPVTAQQKSPQPLNLDFFFPLFLLGWALMSWGAYIYAGEKMPWLFVHIALPHIFLAAWGLGQWLRKLTWQDIAERGWLLILALPLLWKALKAFTQAVNSPERVLQTAEVETGLTLAGLEPLVGVFFALIGIVLFGGLLFWAIDKVGPRRTLRLTLLTICGALAVWTLRTMFMLCFINDEMATEFMVYAHATPDVKVVLAKIDEISWRTTGTPHDVEVAYGEEGAWPFYWYMATRYPNSYYYGSTPEAERLLECPVVIAGKPQWSAVEAILGEDYLSLDYKYIWWPIEDYKDLTWERIRAALDDAQMRAALADIIRDRDYRGYAQIKNPESPFTLKTWPNRLDMHLYVRRDLVQEIWDYSTAETSIDNNTQIPDSYASSEQTLPLIFKVQLSNAVGRGIAVAPDGSLYVADTAQHSIWHISPEGELLSTWGEYGVAPGQFNEPWDVAVDLSGNVYVADTWNHRIQKFTAEGEFVLSWGQLGQIQAYDPAGNGLFYGPRGIAIGPNGSIYVADTGNQRVQVFNAEGVFLHEFGGAGNQSGQMSEPVGIAINETGEVFIADSWNQRVQVLSSEGLYRREWSVPVWTRNATEKPFLALSGDNVFVGDPIHGRVLAFDHTGTLLWVLRDPENLTFPGGIAVVEDTLEEGTLYIVDGYSGELMGYRTPILRQD